MQEQPPGLSLDLAGPRSVDAGEPTQPGHGPAKRTREPSEPAMVEEAESVPGIPQSPAPLTGYMDDEERVPFPRPGGGISRLSAVEFEELDGIIGVQAIHRQFMASLVDQAPTTVESLGGEGPAAPPAAAPAAHRILRAPSARPGPAARPAHL